MLVSMKCSAHNYHLLSYVLFYATKVSENKQQQQKNKKKNFMPIFTFMSDGRKC